MRFCGNSCVVANYPNPSFQVKTLIGKKVFFPVPPLKLYVLCLKGDIPVSPVVEAIDETLIYKKRNPTHLNVFTWEGLPSWIPETSRRAIFRSIARATAANILQWTPPIIVATQLKVTLRDRQTTPEDSNHLQSVILRAMPKFQGVPAQNCVKLLVEEGSMANADPNCYFGKCIAFFRDAEGRLFVLLQWFTRQEDRGFDIISNVPSFKLAPDVETKSYSTLPVSSILNGALMVPGGNRYWALLSSREHREYAMYLPRIA
jgi:hypothetical protein